MSMMKLKTEFLLNGEGVQITFDMAPCEPLQTFTPEGAAHVSIRIFLNTPARERVLEDSEFIKIAKKVNLREVMTSIFREAIEDLDGMYADRKKETDL